MIILPVTLIAVAATLAVPIELGNNRGFLAASIGTLLVTLFIMYTLLADECTNWAHIRNFMKSRLTPPLPSVVMYGITFIRSCRYLRNKIGLRWGSAALQYVVQNFIVYISRILFFFRLRAIRAAVSTQKATLSLVKRLQIAKDAKDLYLDHRELKSNNEGVKNYIDVNQGEFVNNKTELRKIFDEFLEGLRKVFDEFRNNIRLGRHSENMTTSNTFLYAINTRTLDILVALIGLDIPVPGYPWYSKLFAPLMPAGIGTANILVFRHENFTQTDKIGWTLTITSVMLSFVVQSHYSLEATLNETAKYVSGTVVNTLDVTIPVYITDSRVLTDFGKFVILTAVNAGALLLFLHFVAPIVKLMLNLILLVSRLVLRLVSRFVLRLPASTTLPEAKDPFLSTLNKFIEDTEAALDSSREKRGIGPLVGRIAVI